MKRNTDSSWGRVQTVLATLLLGITPCQAAPPSPIIQHRIDSLLKHRLRPDPLPINLPNPFQLASTAKRDAYVEEPARAPTTSEIAAVAPASTEAQAKELVGTNAAEVLVTCATRLKFGGMIVLKDQMQVVINGMPRKEGDTIAADWDNTIVYLRIVRLLPGQLLLRYGTAEATVKF